MRRWSVVLVLAVAAVDMADARDALAAEVIVELEPTIVELRRYRARIRDRGALAEELREYFTDAEAWVDEPPP